MNLKPVERVSRHPLDLRKNAARRQVRFYTHRVGGGTMLVIWVGPDLAQQIGIDCARTSVDLLLDDDFANTRIMGIRANPEGQFRAARRSQNVGVYLNCDTFEHIFGKVWIAEIVAPETVLVTNKTLQFVAPQGRPQVCK